VYVLNDGEMPLGTRSGTLTPIDEEDMENGDTESGGFMAGDHHSLNLDSLVRRFIESKSWGINMENIEKSGGFRRWTGTWEGTGDTECTSHRVGKN
jgi:hypothetical protein